MSNAIYIFKKEPKPHAWARWMVSRTKKQNKNNLISVVGKTGSGKTYSALSICEIMSKIDKVPFTIEHVVFSLRELMDLINSGKLKRGSKEITKHKMGKPIKTSKKHTNIKTTHNGTKSRRSSSIKHRRYRRTNNTHKRK